MLQLLGRIYLAVSGVFWLLVSVAHAAGALNPVSASAVGVLAMGALVLGLPGFALVGRSGAWKKDRFVQAFGLGLFVAFSLMALTAARAGTPG